MRVHSVAVQRFRLTNGQVSDETVYHSCKEVSACLRKGVPRVSKYHSWNPPDNHWPFTSKTCPFIQLAVATTRHSEAARTTVGGALAVTLGQ